MPGDASGILKTLIFEEKVCLVYFTPEISPSTNLSPFGPVVWPTHIRMSFLLYREIYIQRVGVPVSRIPRSTSTEYRPRAVRGRALGEETEEF